MDPMILSHRELRAALRLAQQELKRSTRTPRRERLLSITARVLDEAKSAAIAAGVSKVPKPAAESLQQVP